MPLSEPAARREIHQRTIDMRAYARDDGGYDVEARLVDTKPFPFQRFGGADAWPAGSALHDLRIRFTVDSRLVVRAIEASSDTTPFAVCKQAETTLSVLVGERIARGWSATVKDKLKGAASCTHLMEMLLPMATTALQGIRGLDADRHRQAVNSEGVPLKIDSCYAYGRQREVVQQHWPEHYKP